MKLVLKLVIFAMDYLDMKHDKVQESGQSFIMLDLNLDDNGACLS